MSLKDLLAELQKEYIATFPSKLALIEKLWLEKNIDALSTEYHKLKGTGRTYGVPEISQLGEALETLCELDTAALPTAVPLSIHVLERVYQERGKGHIHSLDSDRDFGVIVELVIAVKDHKDRAKVG